MVDEYKHSGKGHVTLVGAGPGDPDLLTIAAVKAIASADVILVDDLVHPDVLAHASPSARVVHVGKRGPYCRAGGDRSAEGRRPSTPQAFIERLMRIEAKRGLHVVRLKGGDPYVFGRGGEERAHLVEAGIEVRVIPGISSGIAGPAAIGIPVTHRDWSQGVVFVTGHRRRGQDDDDTTAPDVDWAAIARTGLTVVVYMGIGRCQTIVDALIAAGMRADLPAAAVQSAWTDRQRQVVSTLAALPSDIRRAGIASPAILILGDVVRCADQQWLNLANDATQRRQAS
jgi:uroporphyrin-III C-methyltransferase